MIRKCERLLKNQIVNTVIMMTVFCIGVIKITPIMIVVFQLAQELQRMGKPSALQNFATLFLMVCLIIAVYVIFQCIRDIIWQISWKIRKKRRTYQDSLDIGREERVLKKIFFEEIRGNVPIEDEEGLWETLGQLTAEELKEAREERKQLLYEMEEKAVGG